MSYRPIGKVQNTIDIFPMMYGEKRCGAMGTDAVHASGHIVNGIPLTLGIWSCITSNTTRKAVKISWRISGHFAPFVTISCIET